jgi:hypothetical protein
LEQDLPLPTSLQKLAIHWEYETPAVDFGPPDLNSLKDVLVAKYSGLKMIWIAGSGAMYMWRTGRSSIQHDLDDGTTVRDRVLQLTMKFLDIIDTASQLEEAKIQREEFSRLWDALRP